MGFDDKEQNLLANEVPPPPPPPGEYYEPYHVYGQEQQAYAVDEAPYEKKQSNLALCCTMCGPMFCFVFTPFLFLFEMTDNKVDNGWALFVGGLWFLCAVDLIPIVFLQCCSGLDRLNYAWLGFLSTGTGAAGTALMFLWLIMLPSDYYTKCSSDGNLLQDRALSVAFPFDCGSTSKTLCPSNGDAPWQSDCSTSVYGQEWVMWFSWCWVLTIFLAKLATLVAQVVEARNAATGSKTIMNWVVCGVAFVVAFACICPSFKINLLEDAEGSCPSNEGLGTKYWLDKPKRGAEIPECTWRTFNQGTCVAYPYDFQARGQSFMYDPMLGRKTYGSWDNTSPCSKEKGLLSCAQYHPYAGNFINPSPHSNPPFKVTVCSDHCTKICNACGHTSDCTSWCESKLGVTVAPATVMNGCFSAAGHTAPHWLLIATAVAALSLWFSS